MPIDMPPVGEVHTEVKAGLGLRAEGDWWVAYIVAPAGVEGAVELGRIRLGLLGRSGRREAFLALMQAAVEDVVDLLEERVAADEAGAKRH